MSRPQVRLLHTSDLHLGADIGLTGVAWHGRHCVCPLSAVAQLAEEEGCQLLVIAGDLFDSNRVPDTVVNAAVNVLAGLRIPCVIVPGNHDAFDDASIYRRFDFEGRAPHVRVMSHEDGRMVRFDQLSTTVWAKPVIVHDAANRPLGGAPAHPGEGWYIVAAHGQFTRHPRHARGFPPASPISAADIETTAADYVALGHEDVTGSVTTDGVASWYSGSPYAAGLPSVALLVTLDASAGVGVEIRDVPRVDVECVETIMRNGGH